MGLLVSFVLIFNCRLGAWNRKHNKLINCQYIFLYYFLILYVVFKDCENVFKLRITHPHLLYSKNIGLKDMYYRYVKVRVVRVCLSVPYNYTNN